MTGPAVDDSHGGTYGALGRAFMMVRSEGTDEANIMRALREGHFYSSTGPTISDLCVVNVASRQPALSVRCSPCRTITFYAYGSKGHRFEAPPGEPLDAAVYPVAQEQVYLRVECEDDKGGIAWTNPVYVSDIL